MESSDERVDGASSPHVVSGDDERAAGIAQRSERTHEIRGAFARRQLAEKEHDRRVAEMHALTKSIRIRAIEFSLIDRVGDMDDEGILNAHLAEVHDFRLRNRDDPRGARKHRPPGCESEQLFGHRATLDGTGGAVRRDDIGNAGAR